MSQPYSSTFERLHELILSCIAYHLATQHLIGPPADLISLLCTSRTIHHKLSIKNNTPLYANIFCFKFDKDAVTTRLSTRWTTTICLAAELQKRFMAMKRMRFRSVSHDRDDLWTAYLMILESDGCNEAQLFEWARIKDWIRLMVVYRHRQGTLFSDFEGTALTLWLLWMTTSNNELVNEDPAVRTVLLRYLKPFIVCGFRYPSTCAPDSHLHWPPCELDDGTAPHTSGPPPSTGTIEHYGHILRVMTPPLTSAALLNYTVRQEAAHNSSPLSPQTQLLPRNRQEAIARGLTGPTFDDLHDFHYRTRTTFYEPSQILLSIDDLSEGSGRHDADWFRAVACFPDSHALRGPIITPGQFSGNWKGRLIVPNVAAHFRLVTDTRVPVDSVELVPEPFQCCLEEHHCIEPDEPLMPGTDEYGLGDGILNAWFSSSVTFTRDSDGVEVYDSNTEQQTRYETYHRGQRCPYSKAASEKIRNAKREVVSATTPEPASSDGSIEREYGEQVPDASSYVHNDDYWEDSVTHVSNGIRDILLTGKTSERQSAAWGRHSFIGRVRPWDGLVVLLRIPENSEESGLGRWIFKGYVHNEHWIGRWRDTSTSVDLVGLEGGFVFCKIKDETE